MNQSSAKKIKNGFTLIELLVVIAVIGVVFSVIIATNPLRYVQEAKDSRKKQDLSKLVLSMEACFTKSNESYTYCDEQGELIQGGFLQVVSRSSLRLLRIQPFLTGGTPLNQERRITRRVVAEIEYLVIGSE